MFQSLTTTVPVFKNGKFTGISATSLSQEKNLSSCSLSAVKTYGGPITQEAVRQLETLFAHQLALAKEHHLEPMFHVGVSPMLVGQYSDVPGWHCDGVPYSNYNGQPDFTMVNSLAFNVGLTLSSEMTGVASQTYVEDQLRLKIWDERHIFKDLHREVHRINPKLATPTDGQFVLYTPRSLVKAKPCTRRGMQYHLRMSLYEKPPFLNRVGGVRTVYQLSEENGW